MTPCTQPKRVGSGGGSVGSSSGLSLLPFVSSYRGGGEESSYNKSLLKYSCKKGYKQFHYYDKQFKYIYRRRHGRGHNPISDTKFLFAKMQVEAATIVLVPDMVYGNMYSMIVLQLIDLFCPAMDWRPGDRVSCLSLNDCWNRLQNPCDPEG